MVNLRSLLPSIAVYAQEPIDISPGGDWSGLEQLTISSIVSGLIRLTLVIVSLVFFAILVLGGIRWITSRGDKQAVEDARNQITHALIGLAIVFVAWALVRLIGNLFGVDILNLDIPTLY
jgi:succinate dehydrogenase/fumarate reductase cytochrome b subunit